jgi:hypothetical protein
MISNVLREKVLELFEEKISIEEMEEWLVPQLPALISNPDSDDADLVSAVELGLSEMSEGIRTYESFIQYLQQAISEKLVLITERPATRADSSNTTQHVRNVATDQVVQWSLQ